MTQSSQFETRSGQRGQGAIELILVLIVTVMLILGGVYQLNSAFASWAGNYFGEYVACLLETGELPTLGGSDLPQGICDESFQPFDLASGRPLIGQPLGSGGSGSAKGRDRDSGSSRAVGDQGGGSSRDRQMAVSRGGAGSGGGRLGGFSGRSRGGGGRGGGRGGGGPGEETETGNTSTLNLGRAGGGSGVDSGFERATPIAFGGGVSFDDDQRSNPIPAVRKTSPDQVQRREKLKVVRATAKTRAPAADTGMTFGNFLRLLIIAAIVIALVVFLGGQAMQMRKSLE